MIAKLESGSSRDEEVSRKMTARAGDLIAVESERVAQAARRGVIEEVLQQQPARFRVRWEDGHTSIFTPSAGAAKIEAGKKARRA
jgi:translation initiation factor IF-1